MNPIALRAMVRKDLLLFFIDRRSVIVSFVVPIAIASFFGALFSGRATSPPPRVAAGIVDLDQSALSVAIVGAARADANLELATATVEQARESVRRGTTPAAVVIPKGFAHAARLALANAGEQPELQFLYDPSHRLELAVLRGVMSAHVMQTLTRPTSTKPGTSGHGFSLPYAVREEAVTSGANVAYNGYAHSFGGMGIQFLLIAMANLGVEMLQERQRGLWKRLRSAPISRLTLLAGKLLSGALISLMILLVSFSFAIVVFGVRIQGSVIGFLTIAAACALMAASFGLLVAALGKTPATARGMTTLAVLLMVMLGGAWVPAFVFPAWMQTATLMIPVRWAVDGLDAMTWRGLGLQAAVAPTLVLLGFAALFATIAAVRFRWEEA